MKKLILNPNISVGPFVFGTEQEEIWKIMKKEFGSERDSIVERSLPAYESEYYDNPNVHLSYKDNKLISIMFIDDIRQRYCEIYLGQEKIWPRTEKKFLSIFGRDSFTEVYGSYYHTTLSLIPEWDENPPYLLIGKKGYAAEAAENYQLFEIAEGMKKMMDRKYCRMLIDRTPQISEDGRTDHYPHGIIRPEIISLTFDSNDKLIKVTKKFPDGYLLNISLK
jgi:hypothetical protein